MKYQTKDGREWSKMLINEIEVEMLWDSGASISVMNEETWTKIGKPRLDVSDLTICGVFPGSKKPLGRTSVEVIWNKKKRIIGVVVIRDIRPGFIGGVDTMAAFGIQLVEVKSIEDRSIQKNICNKDRLSKAKLDLLKEDNPDLEKLISEFASIFMATKFDLGYTNQVEHVINTTGNPAMQYPRRQPMHLEQKVDNLIQNLEEAGVIKRCQSPWNAPLVIVGKKDGSIRMCADYRGLNSLTEKESFPMPNINHLLDCLAGAKFFSSLDLGQAYYQVALSAESQEKTAFSTKSGQYCFQRLPFGLTTAPATFQRLMNNMLEGILFNGAVVYLDDILIYGKDKVEHDSRLKEVFKRIRDTGVRINSEKCKLYKKELLFLGHTVSESGVRTNSEKIRVIMEASRPKCAKQLRSFLGLTNYYRKFVKDYAQLAAPLYAATTGCDKTLQWSDNCETSFKKLKEALSNTPILDYPRIDRTFILDTDACFEAIGAVLSQVTEEGEEVVIAYGSRHLTAHEKGYCVTRKELLALHEYVIYFRQYLYGKEFIARTDHKALVFMNTTKKAISPQFQTWMVNLAEYKFKLQYRKGIEHANADGLSRIGGMLCAQCQTNHEQPMKDKTKVRYINSMQKTETMIKVMEEQQKDKGFQGAWNFINDFLNEEEEFFKMCFLFQYKDKLKTEDDLIMIERNNRDLVAVPQSYQCELVKQIHEDLCHVGGKKVYHYIDSYFFWPKMWETVRHVVKKCIICAKRKIDQGRTKEIFIPHESSAFLEQIVVDIAHMEVTPSGKRYVIVIIDRFSKLVCLTATEKQDEKTIFRTMLHNWIYKYGKPGSILTDRGRNFESKYMKEKMDALGIRQDFSSPYQHQSNGIVERVIRTMRDLLVTSILSNNRRYNWCDILPRVEFSINATVQSATKYSPFEIVYGRKISLHTNIQETKNKVQLVNEMVMNNSKIAAEKMKRLDENRRGKRLFEVGEEVLVRREPHRRMKNDIQYDGPYKIVRFLSEHQVELQFPDARRPRRIEWLKRWQNN